MSRDMTDPRSSGTHTETPRLAMEIDKLYLCVVFLPKEGGGETFEEQFTVGLFLTTQPEDRKVEGTLYRFSYDSCQWEAWRPLDVEQVHMFPHCCVLNEPAFKKAIWHLNPDIVEDEDNYFSYFLDAIAELNGKSIMDKDIVSRDLEEYQRRVESGEGTCGRNLE